MTAARPDSYLNWTDGDSSKVTQPPGAIALIGWQEGMAPPFDYMNWLFYFTDLWIKYFDAAITTGEPDQVIRFINGGFWSWDLETDTLAWSLDANMSIPGVPDANNRLPAGSLIIGDGQVAYVIINAPIVANGNSTSGSPTLTSVNFTGNLSNGMAVTGPGVPGGTTIIGVGTNSVTMSANATSSNSGATYVFSETTTLSANVVDSDSFIPSLSTIMFAKRSGDIIYWGVNTTQMTFLDGEFKPVMRSGYFSTYDALCGENLTAGQLVYISAGNPTDPGRVAGSLYRLDVSAANQAFRGIYAGIAVSDYSSGDTGSFMFEGFFAYSSLTAGAAYYADPATLGGITKVAPSAAGQKIVTIGVAVTTTSLLVSSGGGSSAQPSFPLYKTDSYGPNIAGQTAFTLTSSPLNLAGISVYINGEFLDVGKYTLSGNVVTLSSGILSSTDTVNIKYLLAQQAYVLQQRQLAVDSGDHQHYNATIQAASLDSTDVYVSGLWQPPTAYTLTIGIGTTAINFVAANSSTDTVSIVITKTAIA